MKRISTFDEIENGCYYLVDVSDRGRHLYRVVVNGDWVTFTRLEESFMQLAKYLNVDYFVYQYT